MVNRTGITQRYVYINAGKMLSCLFVVLWWQSATNKNQESVPRKKHKLLWIEQHEQEQDSKSYVQLCRVFNKKMIRDRARGAKERERQSMYTEKIKFKEQMALLEHELMYGWWFKSNTLYIALYLRFDQRYRSVGKRPHFYCQTFTYQQALAPFEKHFSNFTYEWYRRRAALALFNVGFWDS